MNQEEAIREARRLTNLVWDDYKEKIPQREIGLGFSLLPILLAHIDAQAAQIKQLEEHNDLSSQEKRRSVLPDGGAMTDFQPNAVDDIGNPLSLSTSGGRVDILERAKAADLDLLAITDWGKLRDMFGELIAEVEANQALIEQTAKNFLQLQPGISWEGGIEEAMKAAVSELERLRSVAEERYQKAWGLSGEIYELRREIAANAARIKELEASIRQLGSLAFMGNKPLDQIIAHFVAWGQSNYEYTAMLEAAFRETKARLIRVTEHKSHPCDGLSLRYTASECNEMAREALEQIKAETGRGNGFTCHSFNSDAPHKVDMTGRRK